MKLRSIPRSFSLRRFLSTRLIARNLKEVSRLRAENARHKASLNAVPIGHFTLDSEFRIVESNPAATKRLGTTARKLHLSSFLSYIDSNDRLHVSKALIDVDTNITDQVSTISASLQLQKKRVPVMLHVSLFNFPDCKNYHYHISMVDLSEHHATQNNLRIARDGLYHVANHDPLTRLPNRCSLLEQLQSAIDKSNNSHVALLLLNLDHFKRINDPLGHKIGDELLREVAQRLLLTVGKGDTVAGLGGDEFAIILRDVSTISDIQTAAEKISNSLARHYSSTPHDIRLSASIGISLSPGDSGSAKQLLYYAGTAMNQAKKRGRNCIQFYTSDLNATLTERFELERDLRIALRESQFELYYQPQHDLHTSCISGYEVLLRWNHPQRGIVEPGSFIQVVENTDLIVPLGEWVISEACKKLIELRQTNSNAKFSINVSAKQFTKGDLKNKITSILKSTAIPPDAIELELTESALLENIEHSHDTLNDLNKAGVGLAIDDFGTGYSSFSRLQQLPVTRVKIDRCFVQDIPYNQDNCAIVKAIISVAHVLGIEVVAEGVENNEQAKFLNTVKCDVLQGYYIGRPSTFEKIKRNTEFRTVVQAATRPIRYRVKQDIEVA